MRVPKASGDLHVHAMAGTYVVSLGFHMPKVACGGLLGFSVHRTDHTENEAAWLKGTKVFEETDPGFPSGSQYSTHDHPIQSFQWADYSAKPGHRYTYRVLARKGSPRALTTADEVTINIRTESAAGGSHDIYFNRGISASQEFARRFGAQRPDKNQNDVIGDPIYAWLSRGLYEALVVFIEDCEPGRDALRIAAYEFAFAPLLNVIKGAVDRGVDVKISYDGRAKKNGNPGKNNREAVQAAVAAKYLDYWTALNDDSDDATLTGVVEALTPLPPGLPPALPPAFPPRGTTPIFSPRRTEAALNGYADLAMRARDGLMMTFAFGMNDVFKEVYRTSRAPFRLALFEKATRPMKAGPEKTAELARIQALRNIPENVFAIGSLIATTALDGWVKE